MKHQNTVLLEKFYSFFTAGNLPAALELCNENCTFQVPGKSPLAGKFTRANFEQAYVQKQKEICNGNLKLEVHDLMATDIHATALVSTKVTRGDKTAELRAVHVWRLENGRPVAWYEYPRDLYAFDAMWS